MNFKLIVNVFQLSVWNHPPSVHRLFHPFGFVVLNVYNVLRLLFDNLPATFNTIKRYYILVLYRLEDIRVVMETLQRLQEVLAYIPSGNYMTQHSSGRVVSFEIVHPKSVMYLTSGSLSQYPAIQQGSNEIKEKINNNNDNSKVAEWFHSY